jgi:hypothetical protein
MLGRVLNVVLHHNGRWRVWQNRRQLCVGGTGGEKTSKGKSSDSEVCHFNFHSVSLSGELACLNHQRNFGWRVVRM